MKPSPKRRHRLRWVILLAVLLALFLRWGNTALLLTEQSAAFSDLPEGFDGWRVLVLSDLQATEFGAGNSRLLQSAAKAEPECILLLGDLCDRYRPLPEGYLATLAKGLSAIAPTYCVTGNHDWAAEISAQEVKSTLEAGGVTVLSNRYVTLTRNGDTLILAGIDDPNGYSDQKTPEALASELYAAEGDPFWLLMAHRNDQFEKQYSLLGADLVLSGHAHGGIVRFPFLREGLLGHGRQVSVPFVKGGRLHIPELFAPYSAGLYEQNGSALFVTRGLGSTGHSFRVFNRPELAVLTLYKG